MIDTWIIILYLLVCGAMVAPFLAVKKTTHRAKKELEDLYVTTIQEQKAKIKQLQGLCARLQTMGAEEEEEQEEDLSVLLVPIAEKYGIPKEVLSDPAISKTLKKYKHLIPLVAKFLPQQQSTNTMV